LPPLSPAPRPERIAHLGWLFRSPVGEPARLELSFSPAIDVKKDITIPYGPSNRLRGVPARRPHRSP